MSKYRVLTVGWDVSLIEGILQNIEEACDLEFFHFVYNKAFQQLKENGCSIEHLYPIPEGSEVLKYNLDLNLLSDLEEYGDFTINNLLMSDRVLCHLNTQQALLYMSCLAENLGRIMGNVKPDYVLGSWDSVLPGLAFLMSKKLGIPFYILKFSVIPANHLTICEYPSPNSELMWFESDDVERQKQAKEIREKWVQREIVAPAYVSAMTFFDIIKRAPFYLMEFMKMLKDFLGTGRNKFIEYPIGMIIRQYLRKKGNILFMNESLFTKEVPKNPFFFYGFHMQPESSIDVWAPFYSNQFQVVQSISRAMPVGYTLCVKIHISDADNYSNSEIKAYLKIPNVRVISPKVSSREFIEKAKILFSIQGTIGLEGALLGKPTVMFGDSPVAKFPSVSKVKAIDKLPELVRFKLKEDSPSEEEVIMGFADFLKFYAPASSNAWAMTMNLGLTNEEKRNYIAVFDRLNVLSAGRNNIDVNTQINA